MKLIWQFAKSTGTKLPRYRNICPTGNRDLSSKHTQTKPAPRLRGFNYLLKMIKISQKTKDAIWWMIISVDYNYSRISIADHELGEDALTLWLEDKHDFKNTLEECLELTIPFKQLAKVIRAEGLNSYEGTKMHPRKGFIYKTRIEINEPIRWYKEDATLTEQQWLRETVVKTILTQLVENEVADTAIKYAI